MARKTDGCEVVPGSKIIPAIKLAQSGKINKTGPAEAITDLRMIQGYCPVKSGVIKASRAGSRGKKCL